MSWLFQTPFSPGFWQHKASQLWAEDIFKMTGGRMKIDLLYPVFDIYPEIISTVQGGLVDAGYSWTGWAWPSAPGLQQVAGLFVFVANPAKWNALPPDLKEIVRGACDGAMARSLSNWLLDDAKAVKVLRDQGKVTVVKYSKEMQQEILDRFVAQYDAIKDPMFQKVWKSQKEFMKIYVPYMRLQQTDAEVKLK